MKVLVFTNMYPFPGMPFYGSFVRDEVEALRARGCEVDVFFVNGIASKFNYLVSPLSFGRKLRKGDYDIVHVHHSYCGFIAGLVLRRPPVVWTFHEGEIAGDESIADKDAKIKILAYSKRFKRMVAGRVDAVILVAEWLRDHLGRSDAYVLPSGIDTDLFKPIDREKARAELGLEIGMNYVLFPSTRERVEKRFELAEASVRIAREKTGAVELLSLENVPHEKVPLYMNASNVMLLTSSFEASPVTLREALACNVPVISTDVGDAAAVLSGIEGCSIVPPDPEEIAVKLVECLERKCRIEARSRMMQYSLDDTSRRLIEIYEEVAGRRRGR